MLSCRAKHVMVAITVVGIASALSGCANPGRTRLLRTETEVLSSRELSRRPVSRHYEMRFLSFPSEEQAELELKVEQIVTIEILTEYHTREIGHWKRAKTFSEMSEESNNPIGAAYATLLSPIWASMSPRGMMTTFKEPVPGSDKSFRRTRHETNRAPQSGLMVVADHRHSATDQRGRATLPIDIDRFSAGVRVECPELSLTYELKRVERICRSRSKHRELLKTGNTTYSVVSAIRLVYKLLTGRITPVGFVVGLVLDVVTGQVIDYLIASLTVRCEKCGHQWTVRKLQGGTHTLSCAKCGNRARVDVRVE